MSARATTHTARVIIEVTAPHPTEHEKADVAAIVAVEAATFVSEVFGVVFADEFTLTTARVDWRPHEDAR